MGTLCNFTLHTGMGTVIFNMEQKYYLTFINHFSWAKRHVNDFTKVIISFNSRDNLMTRLCEYSYYHHFEDVHREAQTVWVTHPKSRGGE